VLVRAFLPIVPVEDSRTLDATLANEELIASWRLSLHGKAPRTVVFYLEEVHRFATWLADHDRPAGCPGDLLTVSRRDAEAWLTDLRSAGRSPATIRSRWIATRNLYGWLLEEEEIDASPLAKVKVERADPPPIQVLGQEQLKALLKTCGGRDFYDRRDTAIIRLLAATGLRVSELCDLAVADLELDTRILVVRRGKGDEHRVVRFDPATAAALDRYKRVRARHAKAASPTLFLGYRGPLGRKGVPWMLDKRGRQAGIGHVHPHQLRHTWAHRWLEAGGSEGDLQKLGGWANARDHAPLRRHQSR
jgi:site-specific recombinase XerD